MSKDTENFPQIKDVVPGRLLVPGMEFLYAKLANIKSFHDEGWRQITYCNPFEVKGEGFVIMRRGTPLGAPQTLVNKVLVNEAPKEEVVST